MVGSSSRGQKSFAPMPLGIIFGMTVSFYITAMCLEFFLIPGDRTLYQASTSIFRLWMAWEWIQMVQGSIQNKSIIVSHCILRIVAFGVNMLAALTTITDDQLLVSHKYKSAASLETSLLISFLDYFCDFCSVRCWWAHFERVLPVCEVATPEKHVGQFTWINELGCCIGHIPSTAHNHTLHNQFRLSFKFHL